jgi:hypothetical protein
MLKGHQDSEFAGAGQLYKEIYFLFPGLAGSSGLAFGSPQEYAGPSKKCIIFFVIALLSVF